MTCTIFDITRPPSANTLFANVPGRGRVKSKRYKTWLNCAGWELKEGIGKKRIREPVHVVIKVARTITKKGKPSRKDGDIDNKIKPILDLLVANSVIEDDSAEHVYGIDIQWDRTGKVKQGRVRVILYPVETEVV